MTTTASIVDIDIGKADVVVACRPAGTARTEPNDVPGMTATSTACVPWRRRSSS